MTESLPSPLLGCLICHAEATIDHAPTRRLLGMGGEHEHLTCSKCGSVALFDHLEPESSERWRIKYRKVSPNIPNLYAVSRFGKAGWIMADDALDISTQVYVHQQRLEQARNGDLSWLKPHRLSPPPPLMSPDEMVYIQLPAVNFCKNAEGGLFNFSQNNDVLDTGKFYVTSTKIHLLGQRRDRSHRLTDIERMEFKDRDWLIFVSDSLMHHYESLHQEELLDGELLVAVINALKKRLS